MSADFELEGVDGSCVHTLSHAVMQGLGNTVLKIIFDLKVWRKNEEVASRQLDARDLFQANVVANGHSIGGQRRAEVEPGTEREEYNHKELWKNS